MQDAEKWIDEGPIAGQDGGTCTPLLGGKYLAYLYAMVPIQFKIGKAPCCTLPFLIFK